MDLQPFSDFCKIPISYLIICFRFFKAVTNELNFTFKDVTLSFWKSLTFFTLLCISIWLHAKPAAGHETWLGRKCIKDNKGDLLCIRYGGRSLLCWLFYYAGLLAPLDNGRVYLYLYVSKIATKLHAAIFIFMYRTGRVTVTYHTFDMPTAPFPSTGGLADSQQTVLTIWSGVGIYIIIFFTWTVL